MSKKDNLSFIGVLAYAAIWLFGLFCYVWNIVKLFNSDFEPSYKSEIIHLIGVIFPPLSIITTWY